MKTIGALFALIRLIIFSPFIFAAWLFATIVMAVKILLLPSIAVAAAYFIVGPQSGVFDLVFILCGIWVYVEYKHHHKRGTYSTRQPAQRRQRRGFRRTR